MREFLHVDDLASACLHLMQTYDGSQGIVNVGTGTGVTIAELAELIKQVVDYRGELVFDVSKPDGTPVKININPRNAFAWLGTDDIVAAGAGKTYHWYITEGPGRRNG